jgi:putative membrane protein
MLAFLLHIILTSLLLLLVAKIVRGVEVANWGSAILAAIVLGLVNAVVRPVLVFLTIPITALTFGLFLFVINALMLWLAAAIVPGLRVKGFGAALLGSILLSILNLIVAALFGLS